jgi:hypothetical protein
MAEKSLFFNALPDPQSATGYDRNYNADDISDWLAVVWDTGVVKGGLKVVATTGMTVNVDMGRAAINGKAYINKALLPFTLSPNGGANSRYDYIVIRYNNNISARTITTELVTGTTSIPTTADLTRSNNIYEVMLAYIEVAPNASSITQANITDTRGWGNRKNIDGQFIDDSGNPIPVQALGNCCPYFTAVKGYDDYYDAIVQMYESIVTIQSLSTQVVTNLPTSLYNDKYSTIEVYTNGLKENSSAYTVNTASEYITITFNAAKNAGAKITVDLGNFIDGEGLSTAIAGYTQFTQDIAELQQANEFNYYCNGSDDNILITNFVNNFINGGNDYKSLKLNIIGNFGYSYMVGGSGTSISPYQLFNFVNGNRKVILDFSNCSAVNVNVSGAYVNIFNMSTSNITINSLNLIASGTATGTVIRVFNTPNAIIECNNCRMWVTGYQDSLISLCGTFNNCRCTVTNLINNSYCFLTSATGILTLNGGVYYAYCGTASNLKAAVVAQSENGAVSLLYGVVAPAITKSGFKQTNAILQFNQNGNYINCRDLVSALTVDAQSGYSTVTGTISVNKII